MSGGEASVKFTADPTQWERANQRMQESTGKTVKSVGYLEQSFDKVTRKLTRQLLLFSLLKSAADGITAAIDKIHDEQAASSERRGGNALEQSKFFNKIGANTAQANDLFSAINTGATEPKEVLGFVQQAKQEHRRLSPEELADIARAKASGVFDDEELQKRIKRRNIPTVLETLNRRAALTSTAQAELGIREDNNRKQLGADELNTQGFRGEQERLNRSQRIIDRAQRPGANGSKDVIESIPYIGDAFKTAMAPFVRNADTNATASEAERLKNLRQDTTDDHTKAMRDHSRRIQQQETKLNYSNINGDR